MTTGRVLVKKMLQKARIVTKNEDPSSDEITDGLDSLNAMLSSWSNDSLLTYYRAKETFPLVSGQDTYTIGAGADFNTTRPVHLLDAQAYQGTVNFGTIAIVDDVVFQRYVDDLNISGSPIYLNYDNNYPIATIRLYPIPTAGYNLQLLSEKELTSLSLDVEISLPPGWERALIYNGAKEVAGEYGQELSAQDAEIADDSLKLIKAAVAKNTSMDAQPMGATKKFNIWRGW